MSSGRGALQAQLEALERQKASVETNLQLIDVLSSPACAPHPAVASFLSASLDLLQPEDGVCVTEAQCRDILTACDALRARMCAMLGDESATAGSSSPVQARAPPVHQDCLADIDAALDAKVRSASNPIEAINGEIGAAMRSGDRALITALMNMRNDITTTNTTTAAKRNASNNMGASQQQPEAETEEEEEEEEELLLPEALLQGGAAAPTLLSLPVDMLLACIGNLPGRTMARLESTCRAFHPPHHPPPSLSSCLKDKGRYPGVVETEEEEEGGKEEGRYPGLVEMVVLTRIAAHNAAALALSTGATGSSVQRPRGWGWSRLLVHVEGRDYEPMQVPCAVGLVGGRRSGSPGSEEEQVKWPIGVAFTLHGDLVVCDAGNHRVVIHFTSSAYGSAGLPESRTVRLGGYGSRDGCFCSPCRVAAQQGGCGTIVVSDCGNKRLQTFSLAGAFLRSVVLDGFSPVGVAVSFPAGSGGGAGVIHSSNSDCCAFTDTDKDCVVIVRLRDLSVMSVLGAYGKAPGKFAGPADVAFDPTAPGRLVVADTDNHRVQVLDIAAATANSSAAAAPAAGGPAVCLLAFGSRGTGEGQFERPTAVTVDPKGRIIVQDDRRTQVFSPAGEFVCVLASHEAATNAGWDASGVPSMRGGLACLAQSGRLVVCDRAQHRVDMY